MPVIAFVMQTFYGDQIGGAERQVQLLAEALRGAGWQTVYISERPKDKPRRESIADLEVLALPQRKKRSAWRNFAALKSAIAQSAADLVYQRMRHPYTGMTARAARSLGKPFVWAAASLADTIQKEDLRQASHAPALLDKLLHPLNRYLEDWGILKADAIILQTAEQKQLLEKNYRRTGAVIPNHISISPNISVQRRQPPEILWLSNIKPFKRPELFTELAQRCADLDAKFVMAGMCLDVSVLQRIQQAQHRLNNFAYIGPLEPMASEQRIAAATLLVNTSLFEGFPNAFQQAWIHGVPTLSLSVDPDRVIQREGLGKCASSLDDLESSLRQLLRDAAEIERIAKRAREFAQSHYDLKSLLPRYLALFASLIKA